MVRSGASLVAKDGGGLELMKLRIANSRAIPGAPDTICAGCRNPVESPVSAGEHDGGVQRQDDRDLGDQQDAEHVVRQVDVEVAQEVTIATRPTPVTPQWIWGRP